MATAELRLEVDYAELQPEPTSTTQNKNKLKCDL
jgi:hypothetical protein